MNDKMKKASICSIVSLDIIDFSIKSEAEKTATRAEFDRLVNLAVVDIAENDRMIVDAVNGVAIACSGPLEDALEDALFISLTIRDEILKNNLHSTTPLYVQIGIHLGSVRLADDADGSPSLVGEGLDEAQRVMCFANPNQILVSHVYYEMASKLTQEISQMFEKYDMHTLEHEVYAVRLLKEAAIEEPPSMPLDIADDEQAPASAIKVNWRYVGSVLLGLTVFFVLTKVGLEPAEPTIVLDPPIATQAVTEPAAAAEATPVETPAIETSAKATLPAESTTVESSTAATQVDAKPSAEVADANQEKIAQKKPKESKPEEKNVKAAEKVADKKPPQKVEPVKAATNAKPVVNATEAKAHNSTAADAAPTAVAEKAAEQKAEKLPTKQKSGWESFKEGLAKGATRNCTQGEIAMNQCR